MEESSQRASDMRAVLFDLDGTLLDTYELIESSFHYATKKIFGHDVSMDRFNEMMGEPLAVQMAEYATSPEQLDDLLTTYRVHNAQIQYEKLRQFPGIPEMLDQLQQDGWRMGVATSKLHHVAEENLRVGKIDSYFECLIGSDDTEQPKPHPAPVLAVAEALSIPAHQCFYVGDSPYDIQSANAAGAVSIAVHWGQHPIERLRAAGSAMECQRPEDLPKLVNTYGA